ncbi:ABC transporter ATP-binding protein [bacterium D16-51]|nr:ABC transporter ATP-binding protein [bacterium D16-59]RKI62367.1 ABC transporter ATP-binding protein [bacterium D16-51]
MSIEIHSLQKKFGPHVVLSDITATIEGGMYGLLGRNGAGKTTLMKVLVTLLKPSGGDVEMNGVSIKSTKEIRKMIGYLPQNFSFYPNMTVYDSMKYVAALSGVSGSNIPLLLQKVNLWDRKKKKVRTLSGGMVRRLGIAQALLNNPEILVVDEPTSGLDPEERLRVYNLLGEYAKEKIVILSTHIAGDIEATCTRVGVLDSGKMIFNGSVGNLVKLAEGKVYEVIIPKGAKETIKDYGCMISSRNDGMNVHMRVLSKNDLTISGAVSCNSTVEDAYMALLNRICD